MSSPTFTGWLSPAQRELIDLADQVRLASIDLRQAAGDCASTDDIMDEIEGVMQACRDMASGVLRKTLSPLDRDEEDI